MNLRFFHGMIDENYGWELELFCRNRESTDGFTTVELKINFDKYVADHNPKFELSLILFNFMIFEFIIYNIWHSDHENSPYYQTNPNMWEIDRCHLSFPTLKKSTYHSRQKFYGKLIYWYQFQCDEKDIPQGFLQVPETKYYEFGGEFGHALQTLTDNGFIVIKGNEI